MIASSQQEILEIIAEIVGIGGSAVIIAAYFLLQKGSVKSDDWSYLWLNLIGALMLLYSLYWFWNTGTVIIEIFWIGISLYGMSKKLRKSNEQDTTT